MSLAHSADIYSQPANTGAGRLENTQLASAVDALKREANPVRLEDFALSLGSGFEALLDRTSTLHARFLAHERVQLNAVNGTLTYRPDYSLRSKADLLQLIRDRWDAEFPPRHAAPAGDAKGAGKGPASSNGSGNGAELPLPPGRRRLALKPVIRMTDLRESWPDAKGAIEQLTKGVPREQREVLVWKQSRDGLIKGVSFNPVRGEEVKEVDEEFKKLWHSFTSPDAVDLQKQLEAEGMRVTAILPSADAAGGANGASGASGGGGSSAPISAFGTRGMLHGDKGPAGSGGARGRGRGRGRGGAGSAASRGGSRKPKIQNTHLQGVDLTKDYV